MDMLKMYKHDVKCIKVLCGFRTVQASGVPRNFSGGFTKFSWGQRTGIWGR